MKKLSCLAICALISSFFIGCGEEEIKTYEYFKANRAECEKKVDECKNQATRNASQEAECQNAMRALWTLKQFPNSK